MLNASLPGDQQFRKGIIEYLKQFNGSNTDTDDLWNSLTQVAVCVCACMYCICVTYCYLLTFFIDLTADTFNI